jgi:enamine deaminase RidA (YjgF/YER057c/UK114 family)
MSTTNTNLKVTTDSNGVKRVECGTRRSEAIVVGNIVMVSTQSVQGKDHLTQADAVLDRIEELLNAAGGSLEAVTELFVTVHHRHHLSDVLDQVGKRFSAGRKPIVRHAISEVGGYGQFVEISATGLLES